MEIINIDPHFCILLLEHGSPPLLFIVKKWSPLHSTVTKKGHHIYVQLLEKGVTNCKFKYIVRDGVTTFTQR